MIGKNLKVKENIQFDKDLLQKDFRMNTDHFDEKDKEQMIDLRHISQAESNWTIYQNDKNTNNKYELISVDIDHIVLKKLRHTQVIF